MNKVLSALVISSIVLQPVAAAADDTFNAILGGIIAGAIINGNQQQRQKRRSTAPAISSEQRAENKKVQTALNFFGFPVGAPDGVIGRKTREQVAQYQGFMGYETSGELKDVERMALFAFYDKAEMGGAATLQQAATLPGGARGLLALYRDEAMGVTVAAASPATAAPEGEFAEEESPALPVFGAQAAAMQAHCDTVAAMPQPTTVANIVDSKKVFDAQFCVARSSAVVTADQMMIKVAGMTDDQMLAQCRGLVPAFSGAIAMLSTDPMEDVLITAKEVVKASGQLPAQVEGTAKICVGLGYKAEDAEVVLAAALLLSGIGNAPYSELVGHHLALGFGTAQRPDLSGQWYAAAIDGLTRGQAVAFGAEQTGRVTLLSAAVSKLGGAAEGPSFTLPTVGNN